MAETEEIKIVFPIAAENEMRFTLTRQVSRADFKRIVDVILLAEDSCVEPSDTAASQGS